MTQVARLGRGRLMLASAVVIALLLASGTALSVLGQPQGTTYYACLYAGSLSQVGTSEPASCGRGSVISWNSVGPEGVEGPQGEPGMVWRGAWGSGTTYDADDVVFHIGSSYISLENDNLNNEPGNSSAWDLVALEGAEGPEGPAGASASFDEQQCDPGLFVFGVDGNGDLLCRTVEAPPFIADCVDPAEWDSATDLSRCDYAGAVNFGVSPLMGKNLNNANFTEADISADFTGANLLGAYLDGANLSPSTFENANLSYATMRNANLFSVNFTGANLTNVLLQGADLFGANFTNANLTNANLYGARRANLATIWTGATFSNTICPDGTNSDNNGGTCVGHLTTP